MSWLGHAYITDRIAAIDGQTSYAALVSLLKEARAVILGRDSTLATRGVDRRAAMSEIPRASVVSILKALLVTETEMGRLAKSEMSREYHGGRASGLRTAIEVLTMDERAPFEGAADDAAKVD